MLSGQRTWLRRLYTSHRLVLYWCRVRCLHSDRNADGHVDANEYAPSVLQLWRRVLSGYRLGLWRL
jgi:hypothetical protein